MVRRGHKIYNVVERVHRVSDKRRADHVILSWKAHLRWYPSLRHVSSRYCRRRRRRRREYDGRAH